MDKFLRRRLALGTIMTTVILLSAVAAIGTGALMYSKASFQTFKTNALTSFGDTNSKNAESVIMENVVYNPTTKAFSVTLTNNGYIGAYLKTITLTDLNENVLASAHPDNLTLAIDNAATKSKSGTTSPLTFNVPVGNQNNRILVVTIGGEDPYIQGDTSETCDVTSVTYNSLPLTRSVGFGLADPSGNDQCDNIFYMLNPPSGNFQVAITLAKSPVVDVLGGAFVIYNAAQQPPENTYFHGCLFAVCGTTISAAFETLTDGDYIVEAVGSGDPGAFNAGSTTQMYQLLGSSSQHMGATKFAGKAGSYTISETQPAAQRRMVQVLAAFKHDCNVILPHQSCTIGLGYASFTNPASLSVTTSRNNVLTTIVTPRVT